MPYRKRRNTDDSSLTEENSDIPMKLTSVYSTNFGRLGVKDETGQIVSVTVTNKTGIQTQEVWVEWADLEDVRYYSLANLLMVTGTYKSGQAHVSALLKEHVPAMRNGFEIRRSSGGMPRYMFPEQTFRALETMTNGDKYSKLLPWIQNNRHNEGPLPEKKNKEKTTKRMDMVSSTVDALWKLPNNEHSINEFIQSSMLSYMRVLHTQCMRHWSLESEPCDRIFAHNELTRSAWEHMTGNTSDVDIAHVLVNIAEYKVG